MFRCLFLVMVKAAASGCMEVQRRDEGENRVSKGEWIGQDQLEIGFKAGVAIRGLGLMSCTWAAFRCCTSRMPARGKSD